MFDVKKLNHRCPLFVWQEKLSFVVVIVIFHIREASQCSVSMDLLLRKPV